ncbi:LiaI-LiaF-like domain-containing protein [Ornithinibacillus salinisoli]|uniref:LiaI-LiaF-like domain-containing protein n=1 Tax=Ornithinibacillus salinisoli TaxID=1848459 RepID=A0ABW4W3X5_9BACI
MKKSNKFIGYLLVGLGAYFLLRQLKVPILTDFYSWPTLLIIIGIAFLIYSYQSKDYQQLFTGTFILGLGIHFHGLEHYTFWIDHWAMYPFIVGISFFIRYLKTKNGLPISIILIGISLIMIFSIQLPETFHWLYPIIQLIEKYWPIALIGIGIYVLKKKK